MCLKTFFVSRSHAFFLSFSAADSSCNPWTAAGSMGAGCHLCWSWWQQLVPYQLCGFKDTHFPGMMKHDETTIVALVSSFLVGLLYSTSAPLASTLMSVIELYEDGSTIQPPWLGAILAEICTYTDWILHMLITYHVYDKSKPEKRCRFQEFTTKFQNRILQFYILNLCFAMNEVDRIWIFQTYSHLDFYLHIVSTSGWIQL